MRLKSCIAKHFLRVVLVQFLVRFWFGLFNRRVRLSVCGPILAEHAERDYFRAVNASTAGEEIVWAVPEGGKGGVGAVGHTGAGEHVATTYGRRRDFR